MKHGAGVLILGLGFLLCAPLHAEEWLDFSSPVQGGGGAGVLARGPMGAYYNPANASRRPWESSDIFRLEFDIPLAFSAAIHGETIRFIFDAVDQANELFDRFDAGAFDTTNSAISFDDFQFALKVFDALDRLSSLNGEGLYAGTAVGLGVRFTGMLMPRDAFGISVGGFGIGAVTSIVEMESLRGYRLTDESGAQFEALVAAAIANSGQAQSPQTPEGQAFSQRLQNGGYSAVTADALARQAELAGLNFNGTAASILEDFLINTFTGNGTSLESGANPLEGNGSGVLIRGLSWYELAFSYSFGVPLLGSGDWLALGATLKLIQAYTYSELLRVQDMDSNGVSDALQRLGEKAADAYMLKGDAARFNVGVDLGLIFTPQIPLLDTLAISFVARNVNGPEFRWDGSYATEPKLVRFDPQFRLGASYTLFHAVNMPLAFAFEADLNRVSSDVLPKYSTQFLRMAATFEPSFGIFGFGVRLGGLKNIGDADQAWTLTAGLGFRAGPFRLDLGGMMAFKEVNFGSSVEFEPLPQRFGASAQIGLHFEF